MMEKKLFLICILIDYLNFFLYIYLLILKSVDNIINIDK